MLENNKVIVIHAWTVFKSNDNYFIPFTHWIYLKEIKKIFSKIILLSPIKNESIVQPNAMMNIEKLGNVIVFPLPYSDGYINSIKYFFSYIKAYSKLSSADVSYVRFPVPFGWLQMLFFNNKKRIIHFAGDPIDAALNNPNFSWLKKRLLVFFFIPEFLMYMLACKKANVYTNGYGITKRLKRYRIKYKTLISSTLNESDFCLDETRHVLTNKLKLLYVGYLRTAKGVEIIIDAFEQLQKKYPYSQLTLVGSGDFELQLKKKVELKSLKNISFLGHIESREELNRLYRTHDIFCFASLSEGSPRVILEAMANGINVISTPVGSLPYVFENNKEIIFTEFNNPHDLYSKIELLFQNKSLAEKTRFNAYNKVKAFTLTNFIEKIFNEA